MEVEREDEDGGRETRRWWWKESEKLKRGNEKTCFVYVLYVQFTHTQVPTKYCGLLHLFYGTFNYLQLCFHIDDFFLDVFICYFRVFVFYILKIKECSLIYNK